MDKEKIGALIRSLRKEKGLTQKELAEKLNISDKTVSKWERGKGIPDISIMLILSNLFGIEIEKMLEGEIRNSDFIVGNMENAIYYVCPQCGNIIICINEISVSCCGRRIERLVPKEAESYDSLGLIKVDLGYELSNKHPMARDDHISFISVIAKDRHHLIKTFPEWDERYHISCFEEGTIMWYSKRDGLLYRKIRK